MRYIVFAFYCYYPSGGADDIRGVYAERDLDAAWQKFNDCALGENGEQKFDFVQIYDIEKEECLSDVSFR